MRKPQEIEINDFDYELPDNKIAKHPLTERDASKLLIYRNGNIKTTNFKDIASYLPKNSLLVQNNTKVIRARMEFQKITGAKIEVFCLEPYQPSDYNQAFAANNSCKWQCIIGNLKKWKNGIITKELIINGEAVNLNIERLEKTETAHIINFTWESENINFGEILENSGNIPIPPYLNRKSEESDITRYQTIYSKYKGSVAAPTAGLHFTNKVFESFKLNNIQRHEVTLHVGAGTFKPVTSKKIGEHQMHTEQFFIDKNTITPIIENINNITAVGTTTVRTLESIYWLGVKLISNNNKITDWHIGQWEAYELDQNITTLDSLTAIQEYMQQNNIALLPASTGIMIAPGYKFRIINRLITNFHQPKSTLLLLISAIIGTNWKEMYHFALKNNFRFLSYGDSCLLEI